MFEKILALRYIKAQKRHSIFTISCIAAALALMTLLFTGFSTYKGIIRASAYNDKPYHFKIMQLTDEEYDQLGAHEELECTRRDESDGTVSAEVILKKYQENTGLYINSLFPDKYMYSDRFEEYKTDLIDVNTKLIECDGLDLSGRYDSVKDLGVFFLFILLLIFALRLMIDTAFEISSKERERQFGMLQCMGASPKQIVRLIAIEGAFLCIIGIPLGLLLGIGLSYAAFAAVNASGIAEAFFTAEKASEIMSLHIDPLLILAGTAVGIIWVFLSAYQTGMRITKMSPIQAISGRSNKIVKVSKASLFGTVFGWKGKLAARSSRRQPKRFIITVISLTLSITLFASFSIVLGKSLEFFERTTDYLGLNFDMSIALKTDSSDQLSYKEGLDIIRSCGYFDIEDFSKIQLVFFTDSEQNVQTSGIIYFPREVYDKQFDGGPPISYDELTKQNAVLILTSAESDDEKAELYDTPEPMEVAIEERILVTDDEYEKMSDEEKKNVLEYITEDFETGEMLLQYRYTTNFTMTQLNIAGIATKRSFGEDSKNDLNNIIMNMNLFAATLDTYENGAYKLAEKGSLIDQEGLEYVNVDLKNKEEYEAAKSFISSHSDIMSIGEDNFGDTQKMHSAVGAIKIGMAFFCILIGLIALVNMGNILSTGILNRRSEFAAMQSIGMTEGQLNATTVIECLQYALTSGILATILIEALMYITVLLLKQIDLYEIYGDLISFIEPLSTVWISAAAAFAAAVIASFIPLRLMKKQSIIQRIKTVE